MVYVGYYRTSKKVYLSLLLFVLLICGCSRSMLVSDSAPELVPTIGAFHLLDAVDGIPSEILAARSPREDLLVKTMNGSPIPSEIISGHSPELVIGPETRVSLAGDPQGEEGWSVNNFVLFEVIVEDVVVDRFAVGFHEPLYMGSEIIDSLGGYSPRFEARSPIITHRMPIGVPFVLRATALDYKTIGAVSSLWLIVEVLDYELDFKTLRDD